MASAQTRKTKLVTNELDSREFRFVELYAVGTRHTVDNAYRSAVQAGYSPETATTHAPVWVRDPSTMKDHPKPWVYNAIQRRRQELRDKLRMSNDDIVAEIEKLAGANLLDVTGITSQGDPYVDLTNLDAETAAAITEFTVDDYTEGRGEDARDVKRVRIKLADKRGALDLLSKIRGMQKTVHSNDPSNPMPGVQVNHGVRYDLTKLTIAEAEQLQRLLKKCVPD